MNAVFVELPAFERHRQSYLRDEAYLRLQLLLMSRPEHGDLIQGTGGLRKLRFEDERRGKGRRGGLRIIYFWWERGRQFWLFTLYDKSEAVDLTKDQKDVLHRLLKTALDERTRR